MYLDDISYTTSLPVPEPSSWCLLALGGLAVLSANATRRWMWQQ